MARRKKPRNIDENWHHKRAKVNGGSGRLGSGNMIQVPIVKHRAWHCLFGTKEPTEIARIINETWLDPDWELVARRKK